ncbi:hypothetical protein [Halalkalirubrum salinum]|uniref:hypothetical protein n=1 Tax=Halalkalirubrum salinum TaxID=2563889 RepID=UPI0010FB8DA2|nr:hypothetical protein [Halalkalirubrum salinum]
MDDKTRTIGVYAGVFVGIILAIALAVGVAGFVVGGGPADVTPIADDRYADSTPEPVSENGTIEIDQTAESKTVLIDRGHNNDFTREEIEPMVTALVSAGHEVEYHEPTEDLTASLQEADAFVVIEPAQPLTAREADAVERFGDADGRVAFFGAPEPAAIGLGGLLGSTAGTGPSPEVDSVTSPFGIAYGAGYLYNMERNANNFKSIYAQGGDGDLATGVDEVVIDAPAPIETDRGTTALTAAGATASETRAEDDYSVAVQNGPVAAIGDAGILAPNEYQKADNEVFIGNLLTFLTAGDKTEGVPEPSEDEAGPVPPSEPEEPTPPSEPTNPDEPGDGANESEAGGSD